MLSMVHNKTTHIKMLKLLHAHKREQCVFMKKTTSKNYQASTMTPRLSTIKLSTSQKSPIPATTFHVCVPENMKRHSLQQNQKKRKLPESVKQNSETEQEGDEDVKISTKGNGGDISLETVCRK